MKLLRVDSDGEEVLLDILGPGEIFVDMTLSRHSPQDAGGEVVVRPVNISIVPATFIDDRLTFYGEFSAAKLRRQLSQARASLPG